ncbi:hypothetical protein ACH5RR_001340 [Cinchona calisaya]|uniref:Reverse transcriptase domain-containing protein n=1 Tax=Cinchona calisaya TaxID=153742 RepID=A0ABD3B378_9GENT
MRGLRRGEPISPYLFLIDMTTLSMLLNCKIKENGFDYHPKCHKLEISYLMFADDFFFIAAATTKSLKVFPDVLDIFSKVSGLRPNLEKSEIFFANVNPQVAQHFCAMLGMELGSLPVRYLGITLLSSKPSIIDCKVLIDKTHAKILSWSNKVLSYGGRL